MLSQKIVGLAHIRRRFGYRRIHDLLRLEYPIGESQKYYRLHCEADLAGASSCNQLHESPDTTGPRSRSCFCSRRVTANRPRWPTASQASLLVTNTPIRNRVWLLDGCKLRLADPMHYFVAKPLKNAEPRLILQAALAATGTCLGHRTHDHKLYRVAKFA